MKKTAVVLGIGFLLLWAVVSASCVRNIGNRKMPMDFVFVRGSSPEELQKFAQDIQVTYPGVAALSVLSDEKAFINAATFHNIPPKKIEGYRKSLTSPYDSLPTATLSIKASTNDLGTEKQFKDFVSKRFNVYKSLKLRQDSGSGGDRIADFFAGRDFSARACISPVYSIKLLGGYDTFQF